MFFRQYPEGKFAPSKFSDGWHVWCNTGALIALGRNEHVDYLKQDPSGFMIMFANGSYANTQPGDQLWMAMEAIVASGYKIEVYQMTIKGGYVPWTGKDGSLKTFDVIRIRSKDFEHENLPEVNDSRADITESAFVALVNTTRPDMIPDGDALDFQNGATHIPGKVTDARRAGKHVAFVTDGPDATKWYWRMPDGEVVSH